MVVAMASQSLAMPVSRPVSLRREATLTRTKNPEKAMPSQAAHLSSSFLGASKSRLCHSLLITSTGLRGMQHCRGQVVTASANFEGKRVVCTREHGKNDALMKALSEFGVHCMELPLIEHGDGPDAATLPGALKESWDWVCITSPEAAAVFLRAWREAGQPAIDVAVVGEGTGKVLAAAGVKPAFVPPIANAKSMSAELPMGHRSNANKRVLYPASAKASDDLEEGLTSRGFSVTRLNTYTTVTVKHITDDERKAALAASAVAFGSPTAVRAWMQLVGSLDVPAACIGSTSAVAAEKAGMKHIYYPQQPGIPGWVESVKDALAAVKK
eukprot:jgi/Mesvir1/5256/Mv15373-RA.1